MVGKGRESEIFIFKSFVRGSGRQIDAFIKIKRLVRPLMELVSSEGLGPDASRLRGSTKNTER